MVIHAPDRQAVSRLARGRGCRIPTPRRRAGRLVVPAIAFLAGSTLLLLIVCHWYLLPALTYFDGASPHDKKRLAAYSLLMLVVVLFCLGMMLLMALRIGKRLFPPPSGPPSKTDYIDAWSEAGKRLRDKIDDE
jgi:hypothetical protein